MKEKSLHFYINTDVKISISKTILWDIDMSCGILTYMMKKASGKEVIPDHIVLDKNLYNSSVKVGDSE